MRCRVLAHGLDDLPVSEKPFADVGAAGELEPVDTGAIV
jgi:hypothetical protein